MNITIVFEDNLVIINDQSQRFDLSPYSFPDAFWALQWRNDQGEIEFNGAKPNRIITQLPDWTTAIIAEHARLTEHALQPPPPPTPEQAYGEMISQRNAILNQSDWVVLRHKEQLAMGIDTTLHGAAYQSALVWRQQLRDMPRVISKPAKGSQPAVPDWPWPLIPPELENAFPDYPPVPSLCSP